MFEHIINRRLIWWLESQLSIDTFQFAYGKNHCTTQALTFFVDSIKKGFNQKQSTVAVMIDLEGTFDNVWRKGALYKLWSAGVRGRMLFFINSFLHNRFSGCFMNTQTSEWIETIIGVPQGWLLAVILFIPHISDMTANIPRHIKFADDINAWAADKSSTVAATKVQEYLQDINQWNKKWRLLLSKEKTKASVSPSEDTVKVSVMIDTFEVEQVTSKLCLGVIFDEMLLFSEHVNNICKKALKALNKISISLSATNGLNTGNCINL